MPRKKKTPALHKSLNEFYTEEERREQLEHAKREHHKKTQEHIEAEIFEHIKQHTKKVLNEKKR